MRGATRGDGRRREWVCALVAALSLALLVPATAVADPTPAQAVANLNAWRAEVGEQAVSTSTLGAWNTGCQDHNSYEHLNGNTLTHTEVPSSPGYTTDGALAGSNSVLAYASSAPNATPDASLLPGPTWDGAVFHRVALLDPRLAQIGYDATTFPSGGTYWSFSCLFVQGGDANGQALDNSRATPGLTLYPSPGNGAYDVPRAFPGNEFPDPAHETGVGGAQLGWLISVEINGPWTATNYGYGTAAHDVAATLAPDGGGAPVPVVISECGPSGCGGGGGTTDGQYFRGGFGIFPLQPLAADTVYRVVLTGGTITDFAAHHDYPIPSGYSWCFSTGATYTTSADCTAPTTAAEEPANPNASTIPSGGPTGPTGPSGPSGPTGPTGPTGPGGPTSRTETHTATVGNRRITASLSLPTTCLANSRTLSVLLGAADIVGSKAPAWRFAGGGAFLGRGIKVVHRRTIRRHGHIVHLTTVTYTPNREIRKLSAAIPLPLSGLRLGSHTLTIRLTFHRTIGSRRHRHTISESRTMTLAIRIC